MLRRKGPYIILQTVSKRRWPGLFDGKPYYALLLTCCMLLPCKIFFCVYFVGVTFFSCVVAAFFCFTIAKLVVHFFACLIFALCTVF